MVQQEFDLKRGEELKESGIFMAANKRKNDIAIAKNIARTLAVESKSGITADDVQEHLVSLGIDLGNAAGAIFKGKEWRWTGGVVKSNRVSNHARILRVWELI